MDDEQCAVCGRGTVFGRLYCSPACQAVDASLSSSAASQSASSPRASPPASRYPSHAFSGFARRGSHSMDISASDRESSSASSLRFTSPPSSLDESDDAPFKTNAAARAYALLPAITRPGSTAPRDDYDMPRAEPPPQQAAHTHATGRLPPVSASGALGLKLQFARRPSQTNNRATIPTFITQHRRTASHGTGSALSLTGSSAGSSPLAPRPMPLMRPRIERKPATDPVPAPSAVAAAPSPVPAKRARSSLPAHFARMRVSPAPSPPAPALVTAAHVNSGGASPASSTPKASLPAPAPVERSTSAATVRGRPRALPGDDGEADASETENIVEPLRGRGRTRTRTRRDSTPGVGLLEERPAFIARMRRVERSRSPRPRERRMSMRI